MPNYLYICNICKDRLSIFHSFMDKPTECPSCGAKSSLERDYTTPINIKSGVATSEREVGEVVRQHIEEAREEIKLEKQRMMRENYNDQ